MRVRITRAGYDSALAAAATEGSERSCECVLARAMRAADPPHPWRVSPMSATIEGDGAQRWYGLSPTALEVLNKFDSESPGPEPYETWEFEAFSGEEGTW